MNATETINKILAFPEVDDVILLHKMGAIELVDGRWLLPVNIYLRELPAEGGTLGIQVSDGVGIKDIFGAEV